MSERFAEDSQVITENENEVRKPLMFRVLLLNDDFTPMDFVVQVLQQIFFKDSAESIKLMVQVHEQGHAVCGVYPYDIARTKSIQVRELAKQEEHPLQCTIEPEESSA